MVHVGCGGEVRWVDVSSIDGAWVCQRCGLEVDGEDMAELTVRSASRPDTGIGRDFGFADDDDALRAATAQRAQSPEWQRLKLEEMQRDEERAFFFGSGSV